MRPRLSLSLSFRTAAFLTQLSLPSSFLPLTDAVDMGSDAEEMDVDEGAQASKKRRTGTTSIVPRGKRIPRSDRSTAGLKGPEQDSKAQRLRELYQRGPNMLAQASESDRRTPASLPRHLFSGKRKGGKTQRR